jgi:hypothetical protein
MAAPEALTLSIVGLSEIDFTTRPHSTAQSTIWVKAVLGAPHGGDCVKVVFVHECSGQIFLRRYTLP